MEKIEETQSSLMSLIDKDWSRSFSETLEDIISKHERSSHSNNVHQYVENFPFAGYCRVDRSSPIWDALKRDLAKEFKELEANWERGTNSRLQTFITSTININWSKIEGCTARCPICKAKCELPEGDHTHETPTHILAAFGGFYYVGTREACLVVCSEVDARDKGNWWSRFVTSFVPINELMQANQPKWKPLSFGQVQEEKARNMRYIWWHLRKELCEKYNIIDSTPNNWERYAR
ncbi:hypothetical protein G9A89_014258 [Geosiphon pyriformis]|nr:hypothetical protein G9A89_014258 [Geosiphon pyriformis]